MNDKMAAMAATHASGQSSGVVVAGQPLIPGLGIIGGTILAGNINEGITPGDTDIYGFLNEFNNEQMLEAEQIKSEYASKLTEQLRISKLLIGCILLIIGTIGNFLTFSVFRRQALRSYATSFLLSVLALSNVVVLVLGLLPKMVEYEMKADLLRTSIPYACQIQVFLLYTFLHFTSWTLVLVTLERFISVWFPQQSISMCTVRNAKFAASILLFIQVTYCSQLLVTMDAQEFERAGGPLPSNYVPNNENGTISVTEYVCDAKPEYAHFHDHIFPIFHFAIFCFVPFLVMIVLNGLIAGRLLWLGNHVALATSPGTNATLAQGRLLSGMTMTMFACSLSFFAFTLPVSLYIIVRRQMPEEEVRRNMAFYVMWTVLNLTQYVNNAAGFFYCLFGALFRRELARMLASLTNASLAWLPIKQRLNIGLSPQNNYHDGGILLINGNNNNRLSAVYVGRPNNNNEHHLVETNFHRNSNPAVLENAINRTKENKNNNQKIKNCRLLLVGDSEASAAVQNHQPQCSCKCAVNAEQTQLLEQFGPSC